MRYLLLVGIIGLATVLQAQNINKCGTDAYMESIYEANPQLEEAIESSFEAFYKNRKSKTSKRENIIIPVHIIIVHGEGEAIGTGSNFSLEHIQSQIDVMNQDFGRTNADAVNTPAEFPVGDTGIRFQLASANPNGNPTDGVTRYSFDLGFETNSYYIRSQTAWPREDYMNIWVAPDLSYLGLATLASPTYMPDDPISDFIHVEATAFGGPGYATFDPYDLGRTATHEVGHWLGLRHIWRSSGCNQDDGIADTPLQDDQNFGCPSHPSVSCSNNGDMFMNYMDYSDDACMNAFTVDQGEYMVEVLNGVRSTLLVSHGLNTPNLLLVDIVNKVNPSCGNTADGIIEVVASEGAGIGYTYQIEGYGINETGFFSGLPVGTYIVKVTDINEQLVELQVVLNAPPAINITLGSLVGNKCFGDSTGIINYTATGGTGSLNYMLDGGGEVNTGQFTSLPNGEYEIFAIDELGCFNSQLVQISSPSQLVLDSLLIQNVACYSDTTGAVGILVSGGLANYEYALNNSEYQDELVFDSLSVGNYYFSIKDANGCILNDSTVISSPDSLYLVVDSIAYNSCFGVDDAYVSLHGVGGTNSYTYAIDSSEYVSDSIFLNLASGIFSFYVQDTNNCISQVDITIESPDEILVDSLSIINTVCNDSTGSVLIITNGVGVVSYQLNDSINSTGYFSGLTQDNYVIIATDENNCSASFDLAIAEINSIDIESLLTTDVACTIDSSGTLSIIMQSDTLNYLFTLDSVTNATGEFTGLIEGEYTIEIMDEAGCKEMVTAVINDIFESVGVGVTDVTCFEEGDGSATTNILGGSGDFTYNFYNDNNELVENGAFDEGYYIVEVIDNPSGCTLIDSFIVNQPSALILEANITTQSGATNIGLMPSGGTPPYMFKLDDGEYQNSGEFEIVNAGDYVFAVIDANGCIAEYFYQISDVESISTFKSLYLYPNPTSDRVGVNFQVNQNQNVHILIYDARGKLVSDKGEFVFTTNENELEISCDDLMSGFYILNIKTATQDNYLKMIKVD